MKENSSSSTDWMKYLPNGLKKNITPILITAAILPFAYGCSGGSSSGSSAPATQTPNLTTQQVKENLNSNGYTLSSGIPFFEMVQENGDVLTYALKDQSDCQGYTGLSNYPNARILICNSDKEVIQMKTNETSVNLASQYSTNDLSDLLKINGRGDVAVITGDSLTTSQLEAKLTDINNGDFPVTQSSAYNIFERGNGTGPDVNREDMTFGIYNSEADFQIPAGATTPVTYSLFDTTGKNTGVTVSGTLTGNELQLNPVATTVNNANYTLRNDDGTIVGTWRKGQKSDGTFCPNTTRVARTKQITNPTNYDTCT